MLYQNKPIFVEALTFDELVEFGRQNGANIVNGMPWSFSFNGLPVTHENDNEYLVSDYKMTRDDMLVWNGNGLVVMNRAVFDKFYELAPKK